MDETACELHQRNVKQYHSMTHDRCLHGCKDFLHQCRTTQHASCWKLGSWNTRAFSDKNYFNNEWDTKNSYLPESKQNSKNIFCVSNITFFHSMFLVINLQNNSKSLTQRKLFSAYFHFISWHATDQYRLFSGRSGETEMGEVFLVLLKQILN